MSNELDDPDAHVLTLEDVLRMRGVTTLEELDPMGDHSPLSASESEPEDVDKAHAPQKKQKKGRRKYKSILHYVQDRAKRNICRAQWKQNTFVFQNFNFELATQTDDKARNAYLRKINDNPPQTETVWNDDIPRRAMCGQGYDILVHIPRGITHVEETTEATMNYGSKVSLKILKTADSKNRNKAASYRPTKGPYTGVTHVCRGWHAVGQKHRDMVASSDIIKNGYTFSAVQDFIRRIQVLSHTVNAQLENLDPAQFQSLKDLREAGNKRYAHMEALGSIDPLLMEGRAIIFNRRTERHPDKDDPLKGWAALVILGLFTAGFLYIPALNLKVRYIPGDVVWIRGRILEHEVLEWEGGQRISLAHFAHISFYNEMNIECRTGKGVLPQDPLPRPSPQVPSPASGPRRRGKRGKRGKGEVPNKRQKVNS